MCDTSSEYDNPIDLVSSASSLAWEADQLVMNHEFKTAGEKYLEAAEIYEQGLDVFSSVGPRTKQLIQINARNLRAKVDLMRKKLRKGVDESLVASEIVLGDRSTTSRH